MKIYSIFLIGSTELAPLKDLQVQSQTQSQRILINNIILIINSSQVFQW